MVLFQPGSTPPTVWDFGWYGGIGNLFDIIFWLVAILSAAMALFLLVAYINDRKPVHFYWGISFALFFVNTHVIIFSGTFGTLIDVVPSVLWALVVGFLAVGIIKNVKPDSKLGEYFFYYVLIMSLAIGFFKNPNIGIPWYVPMIVVMALHIPSAFFMIWLPFTTRSENGKSALVLPLGAILMSLVGIILVMVILLSNTLAEYVAVFGAAEEAFEIAEDLFDDGLITQAALDAVEALMDAAEAALDAYQLQYDAILEPIFTAFTFVYLGVGLCFAWGTFVPKRWTFNIPGIELEDK